MGGIYALISRFSVISAWKETYSFEHLLSSHLVATLLNWRHTASEKPARLYCRQVSQILQNESISVASTFTCSTCKMLSCPVKGEIATDGKVIPYTWLLLLSLIFLSLSFKTVVLNQGDFSPQGTPGNAWRHWLSQLGGGCYCMYWVKAKNSAKYPVLHRTVGTKNDRVLTISNAEVEKPGLTVSGKRGGSLGVSLLNIGFHCYPLRLRHLSNVSRPLY